MPAAFFRNHLTPDIHSVEERRVRRRAGDLARIRDNRFRDSTDSPSYLSEAASGLMKLRVLRLSSNENGDVGVRVFP
jgi:hypothetical protein